MSLPARFALSRKEIADKLGLTVQEVRWAEECALRKLEPLRTILRERLSLSTWDGMSSISDEQKEK